MLKYKVISHANIVSSPARSSTAKISRKKVTTILDSMESSVDLMKPDSLSLIAGIIKEDLQSQGHGVLGDVEIISITLQKRVK